MQVFVQTMLTSTSAASRILYGLARDGNAPSFFKRTSRFGVPWVCVAFVSCFICLAYLALSAGGSVAFDWLQNLYVSSFRALEDGIADTAYSVSVSTIFNWMTILGVYLRFYYGMKAQGISRAELPWAAPFQPYLGWIGFISFGVLFLTGGWLTFTKGQ